MERVRFVRRGATEDAQDSAVVGIETPSWPVMVTILRWGKGRSAIVVHRRSTLHA